MVDATSVIALLMATLATANDVTSGGVGKACSQLHRSRIRKCHEFYTIGEFVLIGNAYRNKTAGSYVSCAVFCLQDIACKSFNYYKDDKICQLNSVVHSVNNTVLQPSKRSFYFDEVLHEETPGSFMKEIVPSMKTEKSGACRNYTTEAKDAKDEPEILSGQAGPIHLELRVQTHDEDSFVFVRFYRSSDEVYTVELYSTTTEIYKNKEGEEIATQTVGRSLIGSRVAITFTSALITLEVEGEDGILLSRDEQNPTTANSWSVSIGSSTPTDWEFFGVCNFN